MSVSINGIDIEALYSMIVANEARVTRLELYLEYIRKNNKNLKLPNAFEVEELTKSVFVNMKKKYPKANIKLISGLPGRN